MIKYSTYLTEEQIQKMKRLSEVTRIPQADLLREGVNLLFERHKKKLLGEAREATAVE